MNKYPEWIGGISQGTPQGYHTKAELLKTHNEQCRKIDFGLFGLAWVCVRGSTVLLKDGHWMPIHEARLFSGWVIGRRDMTAAEHTKHAEGWRNSFGE